MQLSPDKEKKKWTTYLHYNKITKKTQRARNSNVPIGKKIRTKSTWETNRQSLKRQENLKVREILA